MPDLNKVECDARPDSASSLPESGGHRMPDAAQARDAKARAAEAFNSHHLTARDRARHRPKGGPASAPLVTAPPQGRRLVDG